MAKSLFSFLRATFYRWAQVWPEVCPEGHKVPSVLGVGDLHVENFGTWRDSDGRLVWGINDFDEAEHYPHTMDLTRLATSALLAAREDRLVMRPHDAVGAILEGYQDSLQEGGRPFVRAEDHAWLRQIAESRLRDPVQFWIPAVNYHLSRFSEVISILRDETHVVADHVFYMSAGQPVDAWGVSGGIAPAAEMQPK